MSSVLTKSSQQSLIKNSVDNHTQEYMGPAVISLPLRNWIFPQEQFLSLLASKNSAKISICIKSGFYIPPSFFFSSASQSGL